MCRLGTQPVSCQITLLYVHFVLCIYRDQPKSVDTDHQRSTQVYNEGSIHIPEWITDTLRVTTLATASTDKGGKYKIMIN